MNHNDLHAFSAKCEDVVIDLPHSGRGCRLRPHPRRRNRPPDPVGTCAAAAPQWQCSALPVPVGSVLLSHPTPLALHQRRRAMPNGPPLCRPIATSPLIRINAASKCELAPTFNGTSSAAMLLCGVVGTITEMRLRRFMRASAAKVGERRSPSWVGAKRFMRVGRVDGLRRGRREPILGGLSAASMPQTPLRNPSTRPRTGSCSFHPRKEKKEERRATAGRFALSRAWARLYRKRGQPAMLLLLLIFFSSCVGGRCRNLSAAGRVGSAGCPRHGCRGQAPRDGFTASPHYPPARPALSNPAFHDPPAPTHEGLCRWLETYACTGRCPRTAITSPIPASNDTAEVPP